MILKLWKYEIAGCEPSQEKQRNPKRPVRVLAFSFFLYRCPYHVHTNVLQIFKCLLSLFCRVGFKASATIHDNKNWNWKMSLSLDAFVENNSGYCPANSTPAEYFLELGM